MQYQQAGLLVYGDDDNYTKFDRVSTNAAGAATPVEKFEFINEVAGTPRNAGQDATANLRRRASRTTIYLRVKSDGTNITGEYSTDGTTWTAVGRSAALPANAKIGVFALSNAAATNADAKFDYVTLEGPTCPRRSIPGDDVQRHHAGQDPLERDRPRGRHASTPSPDGGLTFTTVEGDINTTSDPSGTRNLLLQSADHAGERLRPRDQGLRHVSRAATARAA